MRLQLGERALPTDPDDDLASAISRITSIIDGRRVVALTGAGISTASGIPDYRSPDAPPRTPMTIEQFMSSPTSGATTGRAITSAGGTWTPPSPTRRIMPWLDCSVPDSSPV